MRYLYQYQPDLRVRFAPRTPVRLRNAVNRLCKRHVMPEVDVLRYAFEAATLMVHRRKARLARPRARHEALSAMMSIRTSRDIARLVREIHAREVEEDKEITHADVLRRLLDTTLPIAEARGMAWVMGLRERLL